jgi:hypothetical protein
VATRITTIVLHYRPHGDEIVALWLLLNAFFDIAERLFPGISTANIMFVDAGTVFSNPTADEMEQQGILCIGVGGGRFDEHPSGNHGRKKGDCAATLIATFLGVADNAELSPLLDYARRIDLEGKDDPFDLFSLIKTLQLQAENDDEMIKIILWSIAALNAWWSWQLSNCKVDHEEIRRLFTAILTGNFPATDTINKHADKCLKGGFPPFSLGKLAYYISCYPTLGSYSTFRTDLSPAERGASYAQCWANRVLTAKVREQAEFREALEEMGSPATCEEVNVAEASCILVTIATNNTQASRAALHGFRDAMGALILVRITGNVQIFLNRNHPVFTSPNQHKLTNASQTIARNVRIAELRSRGLPTGLLSETRLKAEGQFPGAEMWHYFAPAHAMLNGTPTSPHRPPTAISINEIVQIVRDALEIAIDF